MAYTQQILRPGIQCGGGEATDGPSGWYRKAVTTGNKGAGGIIHHHHYSTGARESVRAINGVGKTLQSERERESEGAERARERKHVK